MYTAQNIWDPIPPPFNPDILLHTCYCIHTSEASLSRCLTPYLVPFLFFSSQRMYTAQNIWDPIPPPFSLPTNMLKVLRAMLNPLRACLFGACEGVDAKGRSVTIGGGGQGGGAEEGGERKAPAEAKRLQQRYFEKVVYVYRYRYRYRYR